MNNHDYDLEEHIAFNEDTKKISQSGIIVKTVIFLIIAFLSLIFEITQIGALFVGLGGLLLSIFLGIMVYIIYKALYKTNNSFIAAILSMISAMMIGIFAGNSVYIIIYYGSLFMDINKEIITQVTWLALLSTSIVTIGGITILPILKRSMKTGSINKIMSILLIFLFGYSITYMIAFVLALVGFSWLWTMIISISYGNGLLSILFSLILVVITSLTYLQTLTLVSKKIGKEDKIKEYFYATLLVNAIVNLFIEMFRLILKLVAKNN